MGERTQRGGGGSYADSDFRRHYKGLLEDIGISLTEKQEVTE